MCTLILAGLALLGKHWYKPVGREGDRKRRTNYDLNFWRVVRHKLRSSAGGLLEYFCCLKYLAARGSWPGVKSAMQNEVGSPESLGIAFCTNSRLVVRTPFSVTNDIPPRGESKLIVWKRKKRRWKQTSRDRGSFFHFEDGFLCLYPYFY